MAATDKIHRLVGQLRHLPALYRPDVFAATSLTALLGWNLAQRPLSPFTAVLILFISGVLYNLVYTVNAISDIPEDRINKPERPLPSGRLSRKLAKTWALSLAAASLVGTFILFDANSRLLALGVVLAAWAYSLPPLPLKRYPIVSSMVTGYGLVHPIFITGGAPVYREAWVLVFMAIGTTLLKDLADLEGDRRAGRMVVTRWMPLKGVLTLALIFQGFSLGAAAYFHRLHLAPIAGLMFLYLLAKLIGPALREENCQTLYPMAIRLVLISGAGVVLFQYFRG